MAKKFTGFKPETMQKKILPALGYKGAMDQKSINAFLAASPAAAAKMGKYTMIARQMVEGKRVGAYTGQYTNKGKERTGFDGGTSPADMGIKRGPPPAPNPIQQLHSQRDNRRAANVARGVDPGAGVTPTEHQRAIRDFSKSIGTQDDNRLNQSNLNQVKFNAMTPEQKAALPQGDMSAFADALSMEKNIERIKNRNTNALSLPQPSETANASGGGMPSGSNLTRQIAQDPTKPVTVANVVSKDGGDAAKIAEGTGQLGEANLATFTSAGPASLADAPVKEEAVTYSADKSAPAVGNVLSGTQAEQGQVSSDAIVQAQQADPDRASALALNAAQLGQAQTVQAPAPMQVTQDQLIDGSAVDMQQVGQTFGTGQVKAATVQDEMADLMQDFQGGNTPVWAAGAMRAANQAMAARGLSASSMAGMAIVQASMEAALPIAQMDAANKQEMAIESARQRANFMGMDFNQQFETKVRNAARISEIANINFSAEQTIALENARMAQTVDLANLDNRQAKVMADAAIMSQMDLSNLDNRQQSAVQNAQSFLQMDMKNLDNRQQATLFRAQEQINSILSDAAAENASRQFNAASQNQTNQFFASLGSTISQFNAEQQNGMARFNAGEANALSQFNASQMNARDRFNAQNHLVIAQANAQWAQSITTAENAAANQANRDAAMASNNLTMTAYNNAIQRERDLLAWAWQAGQNQMDRDRAIAVATISATDGEQSGNAIGDAAGKLLGKIGDKAIDAVVDWIPWF